VIAVRALTKRPRAVRLARKLGLDANPLRRAADRTEAWCRVAVLVALLIGAPLAAITAGQWAYHAGVREARAQTAQLHSTRAVLQRPAPLVLSAAGAFGGGESWVRARWQAPGGARRSGQILATTGLRAGSTVTIWTNSAGEIASPPLQPSQITSRAIAVAALTPAALAVVLLTALLLIQHALDRRRLAAWDAGWMAVGPRWTRNRP
jgi:hypothetical protein